MNVITNNNLKSTIALAALQDVVDPEIGLNVVDLGLIYQLDFDEEGNSIFCRMTLTTQFCPMGDTRREPGMRITNQIYQKGRNNAKANDDP